MERVRAWAEAEEKAWAERNESKSIMAFGPSELVGNPPPEWFLREMEAQYRKGFQYGVIEASREVRRLYKKGGYVRPVEIANILSDWAETVLRKWRIRSCVEKPLKDFGEPRLECKPWPQIKKEVHARDGHECVECGSTENLEAHHIEAVCEGGGPYLSNLVTLCRSCHRGPTA
jgi:hypothetical protein